MKIADCIKCEHFISRGWRGRAKPPYYFVVCKQVGEIPVYITVEQLVQQSPPDAEIDCPGKPEQMDIYDLVSKEVTA